MPSFQVTIDQFEGPIDALLQMIEKRKLLVNDVSLASITDDYLAFVGALDEENLGEKTHFIVVASTLILIKSKSLLPTLELTEDEEEDIEGLKRRLEVLKLFQSMGRNLAGAWQPIPSFYFAHERKAGVRFLPHDDLNQTTIREHLVSVLEEVPEETPTKQEGYIKVAVHIEEMVDALKERIKKVMSGFDFHSFINDQSGNALSPKEAKVYQVVGFLAVLEMTKNGILSVTQPSNFESITIDKY